MDDRERDDGVWLLAMGIHIVGASSSGRRTILGALSISRGYLLGALLFSRRRLRGRSPIDRCDCGASFQFQPSVVLLCWAVAPVGLALTLSLVSTPIFIDRYFIGSLPALFTLAALGGAHLLSHRKWPTTVGAAAVLAATIVGNLGYVPDRHDDWRAVAAYLQDNLQKSDCVLVYPAFNIVPLRYYLRGEYPANFSREY